MNISAKNYGELIPSLQIPKSLQPDFDGVKQFTKNYTDWSVYKDPTVKQWFDLYFKNLEKANHHVEKPPVKKTPVAEKPKSKKVITTVKKTLKEAKPEKKKVAAPKKKPALKNAKAKRKVKKTRKPATIYNRSIPKSGTANALLRRFAGFIGKYKPVSAVIKLYQDIELAFKQSQAIKNNQHFDVLTAVHRKLSKVADQYETEAPGTMIQINLESKDLFAKLKSIAANKTADKFESCEKRFIKMQGKKPFPIAVRKLKSDFENIDMKGANPKVREYARMIIRILNNYLNKKSKTVEVTPSVK